jgi:hypothetical protein
MSNQTQKYHIVMKRRKISQVRRSYYIRKRLIGSTVAVTFQIIFCAEMHANDIFLFFKNYF